MKKTIGAGLAASVFVFMLTVACGTELPSESAEDATAQDSSKVATAEDDLTAACPATTCINVGTYCTPAQPFVACGAVHCGAGCQNNPTHCSQRPVQDYASVQNCTMLSGPNVGGSCQFVTIQHVTANTCGCGGIHEC